MKMLKMIMIAGLILGVTAGAVQAEGKKGDKKEKKEKVMKVAGKITSVSESSITVKPNKKKADEVTVSISEETKIKINGKKVTAKDLEEGMKVTVHYKGSEATLIIAQAEKKDKKKDKKEPKDE